MKWVFKIQVFYAKKVNQSPDLIIWRRSQFSNQNISDNVCCKNCKLNWCLPNTTLAKILGCFEFSFHFQKWPQPAAEGKIVFAWTYFELILREKLFRSRSFSLFPLNYNLCLKKAEQGTPGRRRWFDFISKFEQNVRFFMSDQKFDFEFTQM